MACSLISSQPWPPNALTYVGLVFPQTPPLHDQLKITGGLENKIRIGIYIYIYIYIHIYIYIWLSLYIYPVLCPKLTLIQPTWSAYLYHLVFLIWYPHFIVFLIWYPYAIVSLYGYTDHCYGYGVAMGCYGLSIVPRTAIVTSQ